MFDHTSLIQFIEQRFGGGDLTSAFDFRSPDDKRVALPSTDAFLPPDTDRHPDFKPPVPAQQSMPRQEPGVRPARAVPYELQATATVDLPHRKVAIRFASTGTAAAVLQVRSGSNAAGPWTYTVGAHHDLADTWDFGATGETAYDLSVYGPNGFFRAFQGSLADRGLADLAVETIYEPARNTIVLEIRNAGARVEDLHIEDAYAREHTAHRLAPGERLTRRVSLERSFGWYDFTLRVDSDPAFRRQVAGHLETGNDSMSDPLLGG